ncbi:PilZ domain-containing protein [Desulfopila sp. IMCC35008]|uniref:PilZ domain-containing protein n=1 Tax=Desulfopila sp. IMCC35008 TaxID=2653858 RepID=UPI0013D0C52E|nr:PilZ domain-containing protein [Desulfopila sp. IMCC35008]
MPKQISKRGALRFDGLKRPVRYKTEFEDGQAYIVNISTSGCALEQATVEFTERERILLTITFDSPDDTIEIQAKVVRAGQETTGLKFQRVSEVNKQRILHFFASLAREQRTR